MAHDQRVSVSSGVIAGTLRTHSVAPLASRSCKARYGAPLSLVPVSFWTIANRRFDSAFVGAACHSASFVGFFAEWDASSWQVGLTSCANTMSSAVASLPRKPPDPPGGLSSAHDEMKTQNPTAK